MLRLLPLLLSTLAMSPVVTAAAPPAPGLHDPVTWLNARQLTTSAHFQLAHATYSLWRVGWRSPAVTLELVFASNATTAAQAGTLRELTVSTYAPTQRAFTASQKAALLNAARQIAAYCGLEAPRGQAVSGKGNTLPAEARMLGYTLELPAGRAPRCLTPTSP